MDASSLLDRSLTLMRGQGERVTAPRERVLRAVITLGGHPDADQVHTAVQQDGGAHLATTYRTLQHLCRLGLLEHVHSDHAPVRYHLAPQVTGVTHGHAACRSCGTVIDIPAEQLSAVRDHLHGRGFEMDLGHSALSGTCGACAQGGDG